MARGNQPTRPGEAPKPKYKKNLVQKAISLAKAIAFGTYVSPERIEKRIEICSGCELVKEEGGHLRCSVCSCKLGSGVTPQLFSLASYEEGSEHGCHHPDGSKWKEAGV